ncbi:MAG: MFS transporter [Symploca sp. SIO2C1]|nr:MFS transporter [Symploca sp. SIO2C1]
MKIFQELERSQSRNLLTLFIAGLLFWSSIASMLPTIPQYIEDIGGTKQQIGLVISCFSVGLILFRTILGRLADQRSRKLVLLIGTGIAAIAPLCYLLVDSIGMLMLIRGFHGISLAAFTTGYLALVADLSPVDKRGELLGYMSLVTPIGLGLGPALGGFLQVLVSYTALFLAISGLGWLSWLFASLVKEPRRVQVSDSEAEEAASTPPWQLVSSPRMRVPALVLLLVGLSFGALITFLPLFIRETGVNLNSGLYFTTAAIASFIIRLLTGPASDRYGRGIFITVSLISYGLAMLMLSQAQSPQAFLLAGVMQGIGSGTILSIMIALVSDRSLSTERGMVYSVCLSGFDLGGAIAPPVFGLFAELLDYQGIFYLSTVLSFLALIIFLTQSSKNLSHSLRFATGRERDIYAVDKGF